MITSIRAYLTSARRVGGRLYRSAKYGLMFAGRDVAIHSTARIGHHVHIIVVGGELKIGPEVRIGNNVSIEVVGGNLTIGSWTRVGHGCTIQSRGHLVIGSKVLLGEYVSVRDYDHEYQDPAVPFCEQGFNISQVQICDDVWVGAHVSVMAGVHIDTHAVVGANSVVTKAVHEGHIVAGVPAKTIRILDMVPT